MLNSINDITEAILSMEDEKILKQVMEENRNGLERLADEEPAEERRNPLKRLKRKIEGLFKREEKVGYISA